MDEKHSADPPTLFASSHPSSMTKDQSTLLQHPLSARKAHAIQHKDSLDQVRRSLLLDKYGNATTSHQALEPQSQIIGGHDEMGRTRILAAYIYRAHGQGNATYTFWITAGSREVIIASFKMLTELLPSFSAQVEEAKQEQCQLLAATTYWLECSPQRWLLIFDDADENASL